MYWKYICHIILYFAYTGERHWTCIFLCIASHDRCMVGCSSVLSYVSPYHRMDNNGLGYTKQLYVYGIVENEIKEVYIYFFFKCHDLNKRLLCLASHLSTITIMETNCILISIISFLRHDPIHRPQLFKKSLHNSFM